MLYDEGRRPYVWDYGKQHQHELIIDLPIESRRGWGDVWVFTKPEGTTILGKATTNNGFGRCLILRNYRVMFHCKP